MPRKSQKAKLILDDPKSAIEFDGIVFPVTAAQKIVC